MINSSKEAAGIEKEELKRIENEAMSLKNILEVKNKELEDHQKIVSKY